MPIIEQDSIGNGLRVDLGQSPRARLIVMEGVTVERLDEGTVVSGLGSNQGVTIHGIVVGRGDDYAIAMGADEKQHTGIRVGVTDTGQLFGGILLQCRYSIISNEGYIEGQLGFMGAEEGLQSEFINNGTLASRKLPAIYRHEGAVERFVVENTGKIEMIRGEIAYYSEVSYGIDHITNSGKIVGDLRLGSGDDTYNGASGILKGRVFAGDGSDVIVGGATADIFHGQAGHDAIDGGGGNDRLIGGSGADALTGGDGADRFIFRTLDDSPFALDFDHILDFNRRQHDRINLQSIDADEGTPGNGKFDFIGQQQFSGEAGELRYKKGEGRAFVYADVDGDRLADFAVQIWDVTRLKASDFFL